MEKLQSGRAGKVIREGDSTIDRLSSLPDFVLHHLLSFLDTKSVVQTSVLSQRWRYVWKNVPALNLSSRSFAQYSSFRRFVENVLSLRNPLSLSKVIFTDNVYSKSPENSLFPKVIDYALSHETQHLSIKVRENFRREETDYPCSDLLISVCDSTLKSLELSSFALYVWFEAISFEMLTSLRLDLCMILSDPYDPIDPFSKFLCLENLVVNGLFPSHGDDRAKKLRISGLKLLSLDLSRISYYQIEVHAPKLKSFILRDFNASVEFLEPTTLPCLDHAGIWVDHQDDFLDEYSEFVKQNVIRMFQSLSNAASLMLGSSTFQVLRDNSDFLKQQTSPFTRLKTLIVEAEDEAPSALLNYLFKGSSCVKPNVKYVSTS
ncbi:FBD-associated F-box protein At1g66310 [Linum perenne]